MIFPRPGSVLHIASPPLLGASHDRQRAYPALVTNLRYEPDERLGVINYKLKQTIKVVRLWSRPCTA